MQSEHIRKTVYKIEAIGFLPRPDELWLTQNQEHPHDSSDHGHKAH
jgi:hypothetical protein